MKQISATVYDYLKWRGDLSFNQSPLNSIDAMIFCELSYLNFQGIVSPLLKKKISMAEAWDLFSQSSDFENRNYLGLFISSEPVEILRKCAESVRFKDVMLSGYQSVFDYEATQQSGTICFSYKGQNVITFRGTDDTFLGWKEDCYLALESSISSHKSALEYSETGAKQLKGKIAFAGHSKGGNIALNTAVNCSNRIKKRLNGVYDFDGPGFPAKFYESKNYQLISPYLKLYYPQCSLVGMIFEHPENFKIVKTEAKPIDQHSPLTWHVCGTDFVFEKEFEKESENFHTLIGDWLATVCESERKRFFDLLFDLVDAGEAKTLTELDENKHHCMRKIGSAFLKLSEEDKKFVRESFHIFLKALKDNNPLFDLLGSQFKLRS